MRVKRAFRVWQRHFTVYRKLYKSSIALNFAEPVLYLAALGLGLGGLVSEIDGKPYINFIAPGIAASSAMFAAAYECTYGTYIRMTYQKTFDAILATPVNLDDLVAGEMMWGATKSMLYGAIITLVIYALGLVESPMVALCVPFLFVSGIIFAGISVMFSAIVPGIDYFNYYFTLFMTPMFLFSGIFFPLENLPPVFVKIAFFTPLYHMVNVARGLGDGQFPAWDMLWLVAAAAIVSPCPFRLMRRRLLKKAVA